MKKICILNGSNRKKGNTNYFIDKIIEELVKNGEYKIIKKHPQDYNLEQCIGCNTCFSTTKCVLNDDLELLQDDILTSDLLIIASPVYFHYFTGSLKCILDRLSWWAHTFRLQAKPAVVLSTCDSNGEKTVIEPLSDMLTHMGANVIATANASVAFNQLYNDKWLDEVVATIVKRIEKSLSAPKYSNPFLEKYFYANKEFIKYKRENFEDEDIKNKEIKYWYDTKMIEFNSFKDYLEYKEEKKNEN